MKKILITGATGQLGRFVGLELFKKGYAIKIVSRSAKKALQQLPFPAEVIEKDLVQQPLDSTDFQNVETVIHLMGESIDSRWTDSQKTKIRQSRSDSSRNLLLNLPESVRTVISASAQGIYGDRGDESITETSLVSKDSDHFLAQVCLEWEKPFIEKASLFKQTRFAQLRMGVLLDPQMGALKKMLPLFQRNLGASLGSGQQWMSWISLSDMVRVVLFAVENSVIRGPVNCSAPQPVRNADFTSALCYELGVLQAPAVPQLVLKTVYGEMASMLFDSTRMIPEFLLKSGFQFQHEDLNKYFSEALVDFKNGQMVLEAYQYIPQEVNQVFAFFSEAKNLETITPPTLSFKIDQMSTPQIQQGTLIDYKLKIHGVPVGWRTLIDQWKPPFQFVDTQLKGPYRLWHHTHQFESLGSGTLMKDRVIYKLPMGRVGYFVAGAFVRSDVEKIFAFRRQFIADYRF